MRSEAIQGMAGGARAPQRIQRRRSKGYRLPDGAVYVGRPTGFGNPFTMEDPKNVAERARVIAQFELWLLRSADGREVAKRARRELRGKDLACWCPVGHACHADVLLRIANEDRP